MKDKTYSEVVGEQFITAWQDMTKMKKPIIAAVNGYAVLTLHSRLTSSWVEDVNWQ
jgi:enoyl-CoA hydratase/carnithine racemase